MCSYIHQVFISDPNLAKLVHFQGYSKELLSMMVSGVPSMHICLDFVMELLSQPQIEKQVLCVCVCVCVAVHIICTLNGPHTEVTTHCTEVTTPTPHTEVTTLILR